MFPQLLGSHNHMAKKPMSFPPKATKRNDDEGCGRVAKMPRPVFLRTRLSGILKMPPYAKHKKVIITNKRKIPEAEISTLLATYTFMGGLQKELVDLGVLTTPCSIKRNAPPQLKSEAKRS